MSAGASASRLKSALRGLSLVVVGLGSMGLLMVWLAGGFIEKVKPNQRLPEAVAPAGLKYLLVKRLKVPLVREVTGSIAAEHQITAATQLLGRVAEVRIRTGQKVKKDEVLVRLEEAEHRSRLQAAEAQLKAAEDFYQRIERQHRAQAATERQLVQARTSQSGARAALAEAKAFLAKTLIRAPSAGVVIERLVELGDTVTPGRPVARLYDRLQLIAIVPESLKSAIKVGQSVAVRIDALGTGECAGTVSEIVPQARALSRSFLVKVTGSCPAGLIPGMFGRMKIPLGERTEIRIPQSAVRRAGQVAMVFRSLPSGALLRHFVELGEAIGEDIVVTSGLRAGDRIVADAAQLKEASGRE